MFRRFVAVVAFAVSCLLCVVSMAVDGGNTWPQFLGPDRNGISREMKLTDVWPKDGLRVKWRQAGGVGMSGLVISRGRLLTLVQREGQQWLVAHDADTGKSIWQAKIAPEYRN